jgi:hypothetical protein
MTARETQTPIVTLPLIFRGLFPPPQLLNTRIETQNGEKSACGANTYDH